MPTECAHATCKNVVGKGTGISFHRFPRDPKRRARWAFLMRRQEGWFPKSHNLVCSAHFRDEDFDLTGQTVRLRAGVEPSVFTLPNHLQKVSKPRQTINSCRKRAASPTTDVDLRSSATETLHQSIQNFHNYAGKDQADFKHKWLQAESRAEELERKLQNSIKREKQSKTTVSCLLEELRENRLVSKQLLEKLHSFRGTGRCTV